MAARPALALALAGAIALTVSACGDDTPTTTSATTVAVNTSPAATTPPAPTVSEGDTPTAPLTEMTTATATAGGDAGTTTAVPPAQSTGNAEQAPTVTQTVTATASAPAATRTASQPTATATATSDTAQAPAVGGTPLRVRAQGEPGGTLMVNGRRFGRDSAESTKAFLARMGTPTSQAQRACRSNPQIPAHVYRWGDLRVSVVDEQPGGDYGFSYPAGAIAGWSIDPAADGNPATTPGLTGPEGVLPGTSVDTLRKTFVQGRGWDDVSEDPVMGKRAFSIFAGDTTNAIFFLSPKGTVTSMQAGITC